MPIRTSLYLATELQKQAESRANPDVPLGAVIRAQAERAFGILAIETRALENVFSEAEWQVILDSFNGVLVDMEYIQHIGVNIVDNTNLNNAAAQKGLSVEQGKELIKRFEALSVAAKWAVLDVAERFWAASEKGQGIEPDAEGLKKLGVVCRSE